MTGAETPIIITVCWNPAFSLPYTSTLVLHNIHVLDTHTLLSTLTHMHSHTHTLNTHKLTLICTLTITHTPHLHTHTYTHHTYTHTHIHTLSLLTLEDIVCFIVLLNSFLIVTFL